MQLETSVIILLIIVFFLGLMIGACFVYFYYRQKYANEEARFRLEVKERLKLNQNQEQLKAELEQLKTKNNQLSVEINTSKVRVEEKSTKLVEVQGQLKDLRTSYDLVVSTDAKNKGTLEVVQQGKLELENLNLTLSEENSTLKNDVAVLQEKLTFLEEKLGKQNHEVQQLNQHFKKEFENLAQRIFEENTHKFTQQNRSNLDLVLNPFKDQIENFRKKIEDSYGKESNERSSLRTELKMLRELNNQISQDAQNLTKALKGDTKTQGDWGEMILDSVLRKSGLREGHEYLVQPTYRTEEGDLQKPDVIINYPEGKQIIVDSKVSLNAYERFINAEDKIEQQHEIQLHIRALKSHIDELAKRNYQQLEGIQTLDYVMMFIPIEPAFLVALQEDDALWDYAYHKKVVIVGPTTLMATLKVIEELWRNEHQQKNIEDIIKHATRIYDKARGFVETMLDLQKKINATKGDVDKAVGQLSEGKGNFISLVNDMKKKGNLNPKKSLPEGLSE
ncbi:DNA recombination protein RmuC [Flammeovirga sp. OC4]|uniref:DNA recombination protein RmuC n=1 Tax=Flammeovirga sp. OC4 TaxID=1382345 RepID=UPI0009E37377|nr:DNA recombination protein RmuC [Flammeovirga sp. OC4]